MSQKHTALIDADTQEIVDEEFLSEDTLSLTPHTKNPEDMFKSPQVKARIKSALEIKLKAEKQLELEKAQLPLWSHEKYGVPKSLVRSSLFGTNPITNVTEKDFKNPDLANKYRKDRVIDSLPNYSIMYSGFDLNQEILDVYLVIIDMHSKMKLSLEDETKPVIFTGYSLLKKLNPTSNHPATGGSYARVKFYLDLLSSGKLQIEVYDKQKHLVNGFVGSLISNYYYEYNTQTHKNVFHVKFEPKIINLFKDGTVELYKDQRDKLGKKQLAKWLLSFYASHTNPFDYEIDYIHRLSGSTIKCKHKFKQSLKQAIEALKAVNFHNCPHIQGAKLVVPKKQLTA